MTRRIIIAILALVGFDAATIAQTGRQIEAINRLRAKIDQDIATSEAEPEYSNIYLTELAVNKNNGSYPAVGIYRPVAKFHYTYGDREKNPYPNRLLKVVLAIDRSDRQEHSEFVFDESERLIFFIGTKDEIERRIYFVAGKPIRVEQQGRALSLKHRARAAIVAEVLNEKNRLIRIFRDSIQF